MDDEETKKELHLKQYSRLVNKRKKQLKLAINLKKPRLKVAATLAQAEAQVNAAKEQYLNHSNGGSPESKHLELLHPRKTKSKL